MNDDIVSIQPIVSTQTTSHNVFMLKSSAPKIPIPTPITTQLDPLAHIDMSSLSVLHLEPIDSISQINHVEVNIN